MEKTELLAVRLDRRDGRLDDDMLVKKMIIVGKVQDGFEDV